MNHKKKIRICFASSSGGHLEQLMMLKPLMEKYDSFILTERTQYSMNTGDIRTYYLRQSNRKEKTVLWKMMWNVLYSLRIYLKEKPDVIVSTGVLAVLPMCVICKLFRKKVIFIESFAKVTTATKSGKFVYRFADQFYVQWETMLNVYPKAIYLGGIY